MSTKTSYGFDDMMGWVAENAQSFGDGTNYLKLPVGVHLTRPVPHGNDPAYDKGSPRFFRSFTRHDRGGKGDFWSGLCADYVMDNKKGIRLWLDEKEKIKQEDAEKFKKYGCPGCTTISALIDEAGFDQDKVKKMLRTKQGVLFNIFYILQADPEVNSKAAAEAAVKTGMYVWETSPWGLERIGKALKTFASLQGLELEDDADDSDIIELLSLTSGLNLAIGAEGEGVGKNSREYTYTFKGPKSKFKYLEDPYARYYGREPKKAIVYDPEGPFPPNNLVAAEASKYAGYQKLVDEVKKAFGERDGKGGLLKAAGYQIPGDDPSDNPLDDNYSKSFADEALAKPRNTSKPLSPKKHRIEEEEEESEDDRIARVWAEKKAKKEALAKAEAKAKKKIEIEEDDEEEEEEERPKSKKRDAGVVSKTKNRKVVEEEEEDEEVEDEEEDEDWIDEDVEDKVEEEMATAASRRKAASDKKFREAVPESDEEEEEEVKPRKKAKKFF